MNLHEQLLILDKLWLEKRIVTDYSRIEELILKSDKIIFSYVNPHVFGTTDFKLIYDVECWYLMPEGNSMTFILSKYFGKRLESLNFDDSGIALSILNFLTNSKVPISSVGGTSLEADNFKKRMLTEGFIIDTYNGYDADAIGACLERKNSCSLISMGSPLQERVLLENIDKLNGIVFTCGGFVSQFANTNTTVYPSWVIKLNLRFLYRALTDKRVLKRLLTTYVKVYSFFWRKIKL